MGWGGRDGCRGEAGRLSCCLGFGIWRSYKGLRLFGFDLIVETCGSLLLVLEKELFKGLPACLGAGRQACLGVLSLRGPGT